MRVHLPPKLDFLPRYWIIWGGPLGGALMWLVHFLLAYLIAEFGCVSAFGQMDVIGIPTVILLLILVTLPCMGIAVLSAKASQRQWHKAQKLSKDNPTFNKAHEDLFRSGFLLGWLFAGIILIESIPIFFFIGGCG